jgi:hypothetical protein
MRWPDISDLIFFSVKTEANHSIPCESGNESHALQDIQNGEILHLLNKLEGDIKAV